MVGVAASPQHWLLCLWGLRLVPASWWVGQGPSTNTLERWFQNDTWQHQCPHDRTASLKWLLPASMSSGGVPLASSLPERLFKVSKWVWPRLLLNYYLLECVRFCMCPLRVESLFPIALWLSHTQAPLALRARHYRNLSSWCRAHGLGSLMWGSDPLLLGENLWNYDCPSICGSPTQGYGSWLYCVSAPPTHLIVVPSLYL